MWLIACLVQIERAAPAIPSQLFSIFLRVPFFGLPQLRQVPPQALPLRHPAARHFDLFNLCASYIILT